jgi:hypothetical protein
MHMVSTAVDAAAGSRSFEIPTEHLRRRSGDLMWMDPDPDYVVVEQVDGDGSVQPSAGSAGHANPIGSGLIQRSIGEYMGRLQGMGEIEALGDSGEICRFMHRKILLESVV